MLITNTLPRIFLFDNDGQKVPLADPDILMPPQSVLNYYSNLYPILTTARIEGPEVADDKLQYSFVSTLGTKG